MYRTVFQICVVSFSYAYMFQKLFKQIPTKILKIKFRLCHESLKTVRSLDSITYIKLYLMTLKHFLLTPLVTGY
jgi:hypothetical protein